MLGVGAALFLLGGGSENSADKYYGKKITKADFHSDALYLTFDSGFVL